MSPKESSKNLDCYSPQNLQFSRVLKEPGKKIVLYDDSFEIFNRVH